MTSKPNFAKLGPNLAYFSFVINDHRRRPIQVGLFALAVSIGSSAGAQTTFSSSNNPEASVRIESLAASATILRIEQARGSVGYRPLSSSTVLRDSQTGVSYPLEGLDSEVLPKGDTEVFTLKFAPFLDPVARFELIDPKHTNQHLYIKDIRPSTPDQIAAKSQR